jgi:hypothetical protein
MLQVLYLDVLKIDRVLHMGCAWEAGRGTSGPRASARHGQAKSEQRDPSRGRAK